MFSVYLLIREYLAGTTPPGLYEARLGHGNSAARPMSRAGLRGGRREILEHADHIVSNLFTQWEAFGSLPGRQGRAAAWAHPESHVAERPRDV